MKLETHSSNVQIEGDITRNSVGIDENNLSFILMIISTNLYSKPIESFVREITSNAWDSHIEANTKDPVVISINNSPTNSENINVAIQDFGVGLSPDRFDKIFRNAGSSTKRDSNEQIGGFGIGRFSALAVSDMVHVISNYNGIKYTYLMYKDATDINIDLALMQETTDPNGVIFSLDIPKKDWQVLKGGIINQLRFFDNVFIQGNYEKYFGENFNKITIQHYNTFAISSEIPSGSNQSILLGKVAYPLDITVLQKYAETPEETTILNLIPTLNKQISVKFDIGELSVTPNREQILYKEDVVRKIIDRYTEFFNELKEFKLETIKDSMSFAEFNTLTESTTYQIPFGDGKVTTAGKLFTEPVTINGVVYSDYNQVKDRVKTLFGIQFINPYYHVDKWRGIYRYRLPVTVLEFLKSGEIIPEKLTMIERKWLKKMYTGAYLGHWENLNLKKKLVTSVLISMKAYDRDFKKAFIRECLEIWENKKKYSVNEITDEFKQSNKIVRSTVRSERYYAIKRVGYKESDFGKKRTYPKSELSTLVGHMSSFHGTATPIVVIEDEERFKFEYGFTFRQFLSRHVTMITGAKSTIKILLDHYPTLKDWIPNNKALLTKDLECMERYKKLKSLNIDVDLISTIEKQFKIKTGLKFDEKEALAEEYKNINYVYPENYSCVCEKIEINDIEDTFENPNLIKVMDIVNHFPQKAPVEVRKVYTTSIRNYLKEVNLVDTNNKIIYK